MYANITTHTHTHLYTHLQASDIRWASRWDTYLLMIDDQIHWFSIINSVMIVLFLTGMVVGGFYICVVLCVVKENAACERVSA